MLSNIHYSWYSFKFDWIPMDWYPIVNKCLADLLVSYIKRGLFVKSALKALVNFLYDESNVLIAYSWYIDSKICITSNESDNLLVELEEELVV